MANRSPSPGTRFKKGQPSANPGGRPKTKPITEAIKAELEAACRFDHDGRTNLVVGVEKLMDQFVSGMPHAQKLVLEYVDGPPTQTIDIRGKINELAERYGMPADELYGRYMRLIEGGRAT